MYRTTVATAVVVAIFPPDIFSLLPASDLPHKYGGAVLIPFHGLSSAHLHHHINTEIVLLERV